MPHADVIVVCFKVFDCDRDGLLSVTELHQMFAAMLVVHQMNQSATAHSTVCLLTSYYTFLLSPSAGWKTLVSGSVKLYHKFERGHPEQGP